jgi:hypothetical protein
VLRELCLSALHGLLGDLARAPERLRDPAATAREGEVFRRLLEALDKKEIEVPDEEMRARLDRLSDNYDETEDYEEVSTNHDAHRAILRVLTRPEEQDGDEDDEMGALGSGRLGGDDADRRGEVLNLLLAEAPHCLTFPDITVALAGLQETNGLKDAITILIGEGLARRQGGVMAPTRPARQMAELGFSIG